MDAGGNIYELTDEQRAYIDGKRDAQMDEAEAERVREDVARLDGFLRGRAESARSAHEKLVWDSAKDGTYRKPVPPS